MSSFFSSTTKVTAPLLALLLMAAAAYAHGDRHKDRPPKVPPDLQVPAGNELQFHASGVGVQIYVWTANPTNAALSSWVFKAPHAVLFHREECVVGIHFAGPTWEANDGSKVVGARVASSTVDSNAIPWLLLQAASTGGVGILADTTYIQRVNTVGGLAPSTPGRRCGRRGPRALYRGLLLLSRQVELSHAPPAAIPASERSSPWGSSPLPILRQVRFALGGWLSASIPWAGLLKADVVLPGTRAFT